MPLFWVCLAFISGIILSAFLSLPLWLWLLLFLVSCLCVFLEIRAVPRESHPLLSKAIFRIPFSLITAALAFGGWRFQTALPNITPQDLAWYASDESISITGRVVSFPEESNSSTVAILKAQSIQLAGRQQPVKGKLELRLPGGFNLSYGDLLRLEGPLDTILDAESPPYRSYLARRGIHTRMQYPQITTLGRNTGSPVMAGIYAVRERAQRFIYDQIPFPESALLSGILLGTDWNIPNYLEEAYRACGVLHIIAISGFNIALIAWFITRLSLRLFTPGKAGLAAIGAILLYTLLVGAEPAVVRAAIMGSLAIPAHYFGRRVIALHSLVIVAAAMLAGNPFLFWDISFQLSFLACLGLTTMVDPLLNWLDMLMSNWFSENSRQWWSAILVLVVSTLTAQFCVSPVLFNLNPQFSLLTLPANLALVIIQPLLMAVGGSSVIVSFIVPVVGQWLAYAAWPLLAYCNKLALNFGMQSGAEFQLPSNFGKIASVVVAAALIGFTGLQVWNLANPASFE